MADHLWIFCISYTKENISTATKLALSTDILKYVKKDSWFTSRQLTSSINKTMLFSINLGKPTEENILKYKCYNKLYNKLTWTMKTLSYRTALDENKNNLF